MKIPQTQTFRDQRARYALRFTCEHCALYDPDGDQCAHGFPTTEHRDRYYENPTALIVFCKDFDLL